MSTTGLSKRYGTQSALADVDFELRSGEVVGVLGQNGAGKSTLVKILAGLSSPTDGQLYVDGKERTLHGARDALGAGIALIPQELAYVPALSAAENIMLGQASKFGVVRPGMLLRSARTYADRVGLTIDLKTPMFRLTLAQRQLVEIAKALRHEARVLLLDEPTAALSARESAALFECLAALKESGAGLIYISHRLDEVLAQTDRVITMRDGRIAAQRATSTCSHDQLVADMVGGKWAPAAIRRSAAAGADGEPVVRASELTTPELLRRVSFDLRPGEVVGLFGIRGSGPEAITQILAGRGSQWSGTVSVAGREMSTRRSARTARSLGIAFVPSDRKHSGLVMIHSIRANLASTQLGRLSRFGIMRPSRERDLGARATTQFSIKHRGDIQPVAQLSGGNQQKVMLASRLLTKPRVLVIDEPSRGVDVAAREDIHRVLSEMARTGTAVVFTSSDIEECVALSDRLLVFRVGQVVAELTGAQKTEARALEAAGQDLEALAL